jgi:hypothetical protein
MFTHALILTASIGVDQIASTPIDHVAVERTDDSAHVLGYGIDGEPAIELAVWHVEGEPRLAATRYRVGLTCSCRYMMARQPSTRWTARPSPPSSPS